MDALEKAEKQAKGMLFAGIIIGLGIAVVWFTGKKAR
jgi:NO-binding membrane sensor protein with MHYT domain